MKRATRVMFLWFLGVVGVAVVAAVLFSTWSDGIDGGVVVEKSDRDAWRCSSFRCHRDERWMLRVQDGDGDRGWVRVSPDDYERYAVGDTFP